MKRLFDFFFSILMLIVLSPLIIILIIFVGFGVGFPVFFKQLRPGLNGKPFYIYKFRSMTNEVDEHGCLLPDEKRMTGTGRIMRKLSLDELPQLLNVIKGDLSLVGPRPLLMEYLPLYTTEQMKRHDVRPGITGWSQINGRNGISWSEKFELDVWYVNNRTFWLDLKILILTIAKVAKSEGINPKGKETTEVFTGKENE
ncbi:sugar transferase [Paenibacillus filicis]|uniref:Sugar transferase n=1 Tax=Paenibacillus filicis TaxID=669464 RepID=A0ABU9DF57_9BACL